MTPYEASGTQRAFFHVVIPVGEFFSTPDLEEADFKYCFDRPPYPEEIDMSFAIRKTAEGSFSVQFMVEKKEFHCCFPSIKGVFLHKQDSFTREFTVLDREIENVIPTLNAFAPEIFNRVGETFYFKSERAS